MECSNCNGELFSDDNRNLEIFVREYTKPFIYHRLLRGFIRFFNYWKGRLSQSVSVLWLFILSYMQSIQNNISKL